MSKFLIEGKIPLAGEIRVAGNKNAALPIIAATVLTEQECVLENLPAIRDVEVMFSLLQDLGKSVERLGPGAVRVRGEITKFIPNPGLVRQLRASILYMGALLARAGEAELVPPGGCVIGRRGIEGHFEALSALGARFEVREHDYRAQLSSPRPAKIFLTEPSVTVTENAMLLAAAIPGETVIANAACEPHVTDLAQVLVKMGASIQGAGSNHLIINGAKTPRGFTHRIMPDHIEAGTFAIAAACTRGHVIIHDARQEHLQMTTLYLQRLGMNLSFKDEKTLEALPSELYAPSAKMQVGIWPGFPTDLMSPLIVLATQAHGTTLCHDWMYESLMFFVDKLIAMGARITLCDPHRVLVSGPAALRGQELSSPDIRAGIALVIAALAARDRSVIDRAELVDRGYEDIVSRLGNLGAKITRAN